MTTQQVLNIVKDRGLTISLGPDGRPMIQKNGRNGTLTDALLLVLKRHRERIIDILKREGGTI